MYGTTAGLTDFVLSFPFLLDRVKGLVTDVAVSVLFSGKTFDVRVFFRFRSLGLVTPDLSWF